MKFLRISFKIKKLLDYKEIKVVGLEGFEPPTPCTPCKCANQTALQPAVEKGMKVDQFRLPRQVKDEECVSIFQVEISDFRFHTVA